MAAGMKFGNRLISPMRRFLRTRINISEIRLMAMIVPCSMLSIFRCDRWAKIMVMPVAAVAMPGALASSQAWARSSSARSSPPDRFAATAVMRVADLATSMRSFRSMPNGSENS